MSDDGDQMSDIRCQNMGAKRPITLLSALNFQRRAAPHHPAFSFELLALSGAKRPYFVSCIRRKAPTNKQRTPLELY